MAPIIPRLTYNWGQLSTYQSDQRLISICGRHFNNDSTRGSNILVEFVGFCANHAHTLNPFGDKSFGVEELKSESNETDYANIIVHLLKSR